VPIVVNSAVFSITVVNGMSLNRVHVTESVTFHFRQLVSAGHSNPRLCPGFILKGNLQYDVL